MAAVALFFLYFIISCVHALPHNGMLNTPLLRDVGITYSAPGFKNDSVFLFMWKEERKCVVLDSKTIASVQVCVRNVTCGFYTSANCTLPPVFSVGKGTLDVLPGGLAHLEYEAYVCEEGGAYREGEQDGGVMVEVDGDVDE